MTSSRLNLEHLLQQPIVLKDHDVPHVHPNALAHLQILVFIAIGDDAHEGIAYADAAVVHVAEVILVSSVPSSGPSGVK